MQLFGTLIWILNFPPEVTNVEPGRLKLHQQTTGTTATTVFIISGLTGIRTTRYDKYCRVEHTCFVSQQILVGECGVRKNLSI